MAIDMQEIDATHRRSPKNRDNIPATTVPKIIARKVDINKKPLALGKSEARSISGKMPYLAGPKNALCAPIRKSTTYSGQIWLFDSNTANAIAPSAITPISATLQATTIARFG